MPLYEYHCEGCGHRFEKIQKYSDPLVDECPNCGEKKVHKLVSSPAIQFKGTGWYITDYAKKNTVGSESGSKGGDSKSGDSKSGEGKGGESGSGDSKAGDSKGSESKGSDTKSSEAKSSDTKSADAKSADAKPTTT
jgi:putative FmdB family regulatory protein